MFRVSTVFKLADRIGKSEPDNCSLIVVGPDRKGVPNRMLALVGRRGDWKFKDFDYDSLERTIPTADDASSLKGILALGCIGPVADTYDRLGLDGFQPGLFDGDKHDRHVFKVGPDVLMFVGVRSWPLRRVRRTVFDAVLSPPQLLVPARNEPPILWLIDPREANRMV